MGAVTTVVKKGVKGGVRGVRLVAPIVGIVREGTEEERPDGDVAVIGDGPAAARLRALLGDPPAAAPERVPVLVAVPGDDPGPLADLFARRRAAELPSIAVVVGDPAARRAAEAALTRDGRVLSSQVLHVNDLDDGAGADAALERVIRAFGGEATAVARRNPALRATVGRLVVEESCRKAAVVGALPLGAADMPALGLIQVRMVARLSAAHDRALGPERALEALAILGAGYGWRTLGRLSSRALPGFVAGGGVAYGGTRAVGEAALARLSSGHDPIDAGPLDRVRPQFDRLLGRLPGGG